MRHVMRDPEFYIFVLMALMLFALGAVADPIDGFQIGLNQTGFSRQSPAVYEPIVSDAGGAPGSSFWKPEYFNKFLADFRPKAIRDMDLFQIPSNATRTWADRSNNDFGEKGITYESATNLDNQALTLNPNYRPWINTPVFSDADHDERLGFLYGQRYRGNLIYLEKFNEGWNIFGDNLAAQNMREAIANGEAGGGDFEKAARWLGRKAARSVVAFRRGLAAAGRADVKVVPVLGGFAPVTAWTQYQLDGMRAEGFDPAANGVQVSIAQYAAGSDSDLSGPLGTNEQKRVALVNFIENGLRVWTRNHRALAAANGLVPVVNAYEMRLGTHSPSDDWIAFQNSPEMAAVQEYGWHALVADSGGPDAVMNAEGFYGFPWWAGIFSLADHPGQFADPTQSQAYAATHNVIDFDSIDVPEPNGWPFVFTSLVAVWLVTSRGRR